MTVLSEKPQTPTTHTLPAMENPEPYTREQFARLAQNYPDLRMERTREGESISPPVFTGTGRRRVKISGKLARWVEETRTGEDFDSSTGITLDLVPI